MKFYDYINDTRTHQFFLLAGPCAVESRDMALDIACEIAGICRELDIPLYFKGSYRKANRSRIDSFTGIGDIKALEILREAGDKAGVPVVTDIHLPSEAAMAAEYVDMLQIPAFLCRQTDLLVAAAKTGLPVNIKKGQFVAPSSMKYAVGKIRDTNPDTQIALTDRGTTFGYGDLVVDFRGVPEMKKCGVPVIVDVTHSLQQPNTSEGVTGGKPEMISTIARASIASGADGIFLETHPDPSKAKSDGANMLPLHKLKNLLKDLTILRQAVNSLSKE